MAVDHKKLTDEQIVKMINADFEDSMGAPGGDVSKDRAKALDYYLRKQPYPDEDEELSTVITSDMQEVVDGLMTGLMTIFMTADDLVKFIPTTEDDIPLAEQETKYISHIYFKRNDAFENTFFWCWDALVRRQGIVKCHWETSNEVKTKTLEGITKEAYLGILEKDKDGELIRQSYKEYPGTVVDPETNQEIQTLLVDVTFKHTRKTGRIRVEAIPGDEYRVTNDCRSLSPNKARMVGHEREVTRSELYEMGFDRKIVDSLKPSELKSSTERQTLKYNTDDQKKRGDNGPDRSQDEFVLREGYRKMDVDGDGIAQLHQVFVVNETLLERSPIDEQPFHTLTPYPIPHKHIGQGAYDKVGDIQDINTELTRQTLNNLYHTNNPGHGVYEGALGETTMDDLLTRGIGRVARFTQPMNVAYAPMTVPFTARESFSMLEYNDKVKRDRTGVSSDSEGLSPDSLKNIQTSVLMQAIDSAQAKRQLVARTFAETGFKSLFTHMRTLARRHQRSTDIFEVNGKFVAADPRSWVADRDATAAVGLGFGSREQALVHLDAIWEKQIQMASSGGLNLTVTPQNLYQTGKEIVKNARLGASPDMFFTDPGNKPAPPPSDEQQALEKQQADIEERKQQLDAERQRNKQREMELRNRETQLNARIDVAELRRKTEKDRDETATEMEKLRVRVLEIEAKYGVNLPDTAP